MGADVNWGGGIYKYNGERFRNYKEKLGSLCLCFKSNDFALKILSNLFDEMSAGVIIQ
jgi:hypothetical protein